MKNGVQGRLILHTLPRGSHASVMFDFLRGIAAIYVMVFHFREQLFIGAAKMHHPGILVKLLYLGTSVGYEFVMAFFVLSGFLISSSVVKSILSNRWSWKTYLINRVTRLWIVLIPALFITLVIDKITSLSAGSTNFYASSLHASFFVGNLFFLQGILVPIFGLNGPLWSLSYEFWYYILFPCIALIILSPKPIHKTLYFIIAAVVGFFLGKLIMLYFLVWLLGSMIVFLPAIKINRQISQRLVILLTGLFTVVVMITSKYVQMTFHQSGLYKTFPSELCVGIAFTALLYVLLHRGSNRSTSSRSLVRISRLISGFSYTLYLTHYPLILALRNFVGYQQWAPDIWNSLKGITIVIVILVCAWLISRITEAKTDVVRHIVLHALHQDDLKSQQPHLSASDST